MGKRVPRLRTKGLAQARPGTRLHYMSHPSPHDNPYQDRATYHITPRKTEIMWDTTGFEDCDFNPCWHEKALKSEDKFLDQEPRAPTAYAYDLYPNMFTWTGGGHSVDQVLVGRSIPLDLGQWLDDFAANAEYHYKVAVEPAGSIINFLIEAKDICTLSIDTLEALWKKIQRALKVFKRMIDEGASFWLAFNFAIRPTIQDVKNAFDTLKKAQKRLKWLRERNHKNTKIKYREGAREFSGTCIVPHSIPTSGDRITPIPAPGESEGYEVDAPLDVELEVEYKATVKLSSWAWVRFDIDDAYLDEIFGLGIIMMVMQGLYNPASIVWEATPFSWLIDYFRTQRSKIEQLLATDLSPLKDGEILAVGWSIKVEIDADCTWVLGRTTEFVQRKDAGAVKYYLFQRLPGLPDAGSSPFTVPMSWYKLSIILALIASFRRRK